MADLPGGTMPFARPILSLALFLSLALPVQAVENPFYDWLEPTDPGYVLLQNDTLKSSQTGWVVDRLKAGKRLPQASARDLAARLMEDPMLTQAQHEELDLAFPPEVMVLEPGFKKNEKHVDDLADHMDLVEAQLDQFERSWRSNIVGPL